MAIINDPQDIKNLRESGKILVGALAAMVDAVRSGITTQELDVVARKEIERHGGKPSFLGYRGYPAAACISLNAEVVHGIPRDQRIFEGDVYSFDLGVNYKGMITDAATTQVFGQVEPKVKNLVAATAQALEHGIAVALKDGFVGDIGAAIGEALTAAKVTIVHDLVGHGTGRAVHEDPMVPNFGHRGEGERIAHGEVLALEPIACLGSEDLLLQPDGWTLVTKDESLASHHEKTLIITENGPEVLTPHDFPVVHER